MDTEADYIVVGAGSAGCVLAARLSEDPAHSVLLLEAGPPDRSLWIHLPIGYGKTMWDSTYNWCFHTDPDPNMNGRRIYWPRGKTLGGSFERPLPTGTYEVRWAIAAADGHRMTGSYSFTVR